MGTSGVLWKGKKTAIIDTLKKRNGVVSLAAKDFGINRHTLTKRIQEDSELQELVERLRNDFVEQRLDSAEDTIIFALQRRDIDLSNALRAAFFVLNNLGRRRGYVPPRLAEREMEADYEAVRKEIVMEGEIQKRVAKAFENRGLKATEAECSGRSPPYEIN